MDTNLVLRRVNKEEVRKKFFDFHNMVPTSIGTFLFEI